MACDVMEAKVAPILLLTVMRGGFSGVFFFSIFLNYYFLALLLLYLTWCTMWRLCSLSLTANSIGPDAISSKHRSCIAHTGEYSY